MCTSDKQLVLFVHVPTTNLFAGHVCEQAYSNLLMSVPWRNVDCTICICMYLYNSFPPSNFLLGILNDAFATEIYSSPTHSEIILQAFITLHSMCYCKIPL